ncbi:MAG: secretion protein HlyD [Cobetia sp.]|mgnify:FL=1|jgi:membrane fusion protein (multidrug efflux system)|uniref:HlyD family secretion protein n=1 Tax=Cobetia sp. TaxID=1873876 RepID=UPI000C510B46|nr:HlyD family secretion protein [Cobetia sp.]MBF10603.1 secretion protein HlyD [Cobetia sp.]MBK09555.1 secretion protein HlyD [Cobetia sp.]HAR10149.1 HlyD family secretion protein [Cobetia sp.]HBJ27724.1 HlyD family secretion protein [Cobetia sp.]|tara:strand:- start:63831 stop:64958 length:1128 start_codon:yes stop_codon:yes gene_type:complete
MNKAGKGVVALIVVAGVIAGGVMGGEWWQVGRFMQETDNAYVRTDSVAVRSEITARVTRMLVHDNQPVKKRQLLVQLDDEDARANLDQASAALDNARTGEVQAERQLDLQGAKIDEAKAALASARAERDQAALHLKRSRSLESRSYASRQSYEDDQVTLRTAEASVAQKQAALVSARQQLEVYKAQLESARAQVVSAAADLAYARHQLEKTSIYAPQDGVVGNRSVEVGTMASASLTLMQLVPVKSAYVVANYKETQTERMRVGQPVSLEVDAYPDIEFEGVVDSLAPATGTEFSLLPTDNATGNFNKIVQRVPVRIRLTGPVDALPRLRAGLSVIPSVDTRELSDTGTYAVDSLSRDVIAPGAAQVASADRGAQ